MNKNFRYKQKQFHSLMGRILIMVCCLFSFTGCSETLSSITGDVGQIVEDFGNDSDKKFSANNLQKFQMNVTSKGRFLKSNGEITVFLNGYELGTVESGETHGFIMYIDPGTYTLSIKEDGKWTKEKAEIRVPDFSDMVFEPEVFVVYKSGKISWMANDDEDYDEKFASISIYDENIHVIILPGTEDAINYQDSDSKEDDDE